MSARLAEVDGFVFTDLSGYHTAYEKYRGDVLAAHGHARDAKNVRLNGGFFALDVLIGGRWVPFTYDNVAARDRVKMGGVFRLRIREGTLP